jgi:hypothetical protein
VHVTIESKHKPEIDQDSSPEDKRRARVAAEATEGTDLPKADSLLDGVPGLGGGRGLPGSGGGHHPGDDDGCGENSYRE